MFSVVCHSCKHVVGVFIPGKLTLCYNGCCMHSQELVQGFDQETAAVVMARLASLKMETEVPYTSSSLLAIVGFSLTIT